MAEVNAGVMSNCFSFGQSASETIQFLVAQSLCEQTYGFGTPEYLANFDPAAMTCNFNGIFTGMQCPPGQTITSITLSAQGENVLNCSNPYSPETCPNSWVQSVDANGNFSCVDFSALIDTSTLNFVPGQSCQLGVVNNMIKLVCN